MNGREEYEARERWIERHSEEIIEAYKDTITMIEDVPESFTEKYADMNITYDEDVPDEEPTRKEIGKDGQTRII